MSKAFSGTAVTFIAAAALSSALAQTGATGKTLFERHLSATAKQESTFADVMNAMPNSPSGKFPSSILVANSRSLQKGFTSPQDPRILFSIPENGAPDTFLGHARKSGETEVISWNPENAQYEFLLVKMGINGLPAKVTHPAPALCLSCHQNRGPIFTHFPWAETDFNPELQAKTANPFQDIQNKRQTGSGNGFGLDGAVRQSNREVQNAQICKEFCKGDLECNRYLLYFLLEGQMDQTEPSNSVRSVEFQTRFSKLLPKDGFAFPQSTIPDRDPLDSPEKGGAVSLAMNPDATQPLADRILNTTDSMSTRSLLNQISITNNRGMPTSQVQFNVVKIYGADVGSVSNPSTPRAQRGNLGIDEIVRRFQFGNSIGTCVRGSEKLLKELKAHSKRDLERQIFTEKKFDSVLSTSNWPMSGEAVRMSLPKSSIDHQMLAACGIDERGMPISTAEIARMQAMQTEVLAPASAVALTATDRAIAIKDFKAACAACHGPGTPMTFSSKSKNFTFEFGNLQNLKDYGKEGGSVPYKGSKTIAEVLKSGAMPPNAEATGFTDEQRQLMIQVLEEQQ